jgi:hypothetical protein
MESVGDGVALFSRNFLLTLSEANFLTGGGWEEEVDEGAGEAPREEAALGAGKEALLAAGEAKDVEASLEIVD